MVTSPPKLLRFRAPAADVARARAVQRRGRPGDPVPPFTVVLRGIFAAGLAAVESTPADVAIEPRVRA